MFLQHDTYVFIGVTIYLFAVVSLATRGDERLRAEIASAIIAILLSFMPDLPIPHVSAIMLTYYTLDICFTSRLTRDFVLHHVFSSVCSLCFGSRFPIAFRAYIRLEQSTITINAYHLSKRLKLPKIANTAILVALAGHFAESRIYTLFFTTIETITTILDEPAGSIWEWVALRFLCAALTWFLFLNIWWAGKFLRPVVPARYMEYYQHIYPATKPKKE